ncbi:MAG: hypothetical protein IKA85_06745 [Clostridia bacterium]|nr:hypothetical protein [Clostridia bacterium]
MFILIDKNTNRIVNISEKGFISYSDNLILAEAESLPNDYDFLYATNIEEKTDTWEDVIEDYDGNGNIVAKTEEKSRTYFTCDLVAKFRPQPTAEQLEKAKEKRHDELSKKEIAKLYSLEDENKIMREYLAKPNDETAKAKFIKYNEDVEACIEKARKEVWGE